MTLSPAVLSAYQIPYFDRSAAVEALAQFLIDRRDDVIDVLTDATSYSAAASELSASVSALRHAATELETTRPPAIERMAVFMPSNIVLYSYVLYLIIPSLFVRKIHFRPSTYVSEQLNRLHALLEPVHRLPVVLQPLSQRAFVDESVRTANIVVFTGTYANAERVKGELRKDQLYIFFGQGVNPFIVGEHANVQTAVNDVIRARLYNTGQDCMGPDAIFVHRSAKSAFLEVLQRQLNDLQFGSRKDPSADYCPIFYPATLDTLSNYFISNARFVLTGGVIDYRHSKVAPTILHSCLADRSPIVEFFGPVFNVISYDDNESLVRELGSTFYRDRALGASVYGNTPIAAFLRTNHTVSVEATLFDVENGNLPFGGYGSMANYVCFQGRSTAIPILISQVAADLL